MKTRVPKENWASEKVRKYVPPIREKAVLFAIAAHCRPDGTNAWPSMKAIAEDLGISPRTVKRHVKQLERDRLLKVMRPGRNDYLPNMYEIVLCRWTTAELDLITAGTGGWIELPLDLANVPEGVAKVGWWEDMFGGALKISTAGGKGGKG